MNNLTPTDKPDVELQDIITDPEGTWGRVKAIDTANDECTVVTFKKHAQAVWGTIKGTLADQQDLKTVLDSKIESVNGHSTTAQSKAVTLGAEDLLARSNDKYGNLNELLYLIDIGMTPMEAMIYLNSVQQKLKDVDIQ